jgi:hypothetical protein
MVQQYVILGHSNIKKNAELATVPPGMKLIFPAKCGHSLSKDPMYRGIYGKNNVAELFSMGGNVRKNLRNFLGNRYVGINNAYKLNQKGLERFEFNAGNKFRNQVVQITPFKVSKGQGVFHSGVYKVPFNILNKENMSNHSIIPYKNGAFALSNILEYIKNHHSGNDKTVVYGHFCRTFQRVNRENSRNRVFEFKIQGQKYRFTKAQIRAIINSNSPLSPISNMVKKLYLFYKEQKKTNGVRGRSVGRRPKTIT